MPEILVLRQPEDGVYDRIPVDEEDLGEKIEEVYRKLNANYTFEVLYDAHPRTEFR